MKLNRHEIRKGPFVLSLTAFLLAAVPGQAGQKPKVLINRVEFRDRVFACWLGKNIGGTLGMPFEGKKEEQNISFYTNLKPGEPAANDDYVWRGHSPGFHNPAPARNMMEAFSRRERPGCGFARTS